MQDEANARATATTINGQQHTTYSSYANTRPTLDLHKSLASYSTHSHTVAKNLKLAGTTAPHSAPVPMPTCFAAASVVFTLRSCTTQACSQSVASTLAQTG